jgi:tRNA(adenine34) deaminase
MSAAAEAGLDGRSDSDYMQCALQRARDARAAGEVPVGAVLVRDNRVIAAGANRPIGGCDPTAHAEIEALRAGAQLLGNYRLTGCVLYVTLEPCLMCAAALLQARVRRLVFGAWDPQFGAAGSMIDVFRLPGLNHRVDVFGGVLAEQCNALLRGFFEQQR